MASTYLAVALVIIILVLAVILFRLRTTNHAASSVKVNATSKDHASSQGDVSTAAMPPLIVYYGSQTGTAERFAKRIAKEATANGFAGRMVDLEEFSVATRGAPTVAAAKAALASGHGLSVFLMATYGEGEPTDNANHFSKWISDSEVEASSKAGAALLGKLKYAVFGLGNKQYEHYNRMGKVVNERLHVLGATRFFSHGEGDDGADLEADFDAWIEGGLWEAARKAAGGAGGEEGRVGGAGSMAARPVEHAITAPEVTWRVKWLAKGQGRVGKVKKGEEEVDGAGLADMSSKHFFTARPARVVVNRELRQRPAVGESTRHVEIDLSSTNMSYTTADNLHVCPTNEPADAAAVAAALGYEPEAVFTLESSVRDARPLFPTPTSVADVLVRCIDLGGMPDREVLAGLAWHATGADKTRLAQAAGRDAPGKAAYASWVSTPQRSLAEVLLQCASLHAKNGNAAVPFEALLAVAPLLQARPYTIASSSSTQPSTVAVCATVLDAPKPGGDRGRRLKGAATNAMLRALPKAASAGAAGGNGPPSSSSSSTPIPDAIARLCPERDSAGHPLLRVYVRPSTFHLPADMSLPVLMVGPGTGIAPMRAFLHERRWQRSVSGAGAVGPTVLFFGCKTRDTDYIYSDELASFVADGTLTALHVAFSREGGESAPKRYVQHVLAEQGEAVWEWLKPRLTGQGKGASTGECSGGGSVYVCGATAMGTEVHAALGSIIAERGPRDPASSSLLALAAQSSQGTGVGVKSWAVYLPAMQAAGRYVQELWTT